MAKQKKQIKKISASSRVSLNFLGGIKEELKKVTWPTRQETIRLTMIVVSVSLIIGLYIGIIDILLARLLRMLTA